jgi:hypothetical protein
MPHLPPDKAQRPINHQTRPNAPLTIRQGPFMILLFHSYTFVNLSVKEL